VAAAGAAIDPSSATAAAVGHARAKKNAKDDFLKIVGQF
jgi:hypothetical protein